MNRKMLCRLLECEGHTCVQAVDGLDAVEKIKDNIQENIIENIRGIMNNNLQKKIQKRSSRISKMNEMNRSIKSDYNGFNENREKTVENYEKISVSYSRSVSETLHRIGSNVNNNCRLSDVTNNYTNSTYNTNNTNNTSNSNNTSDPPSTHSNIYSNPQSLNNSSPTTKNTSKNNSKNNSLNNSRKTSRSNSKNNSHNNSYCTSPCEFLENIVNSSVDDFCRNDDNIENNANFNRNNFLFDAILMDFMMPNMDGPTGRFLCVLVCFYVYF